MNRLWVRFSLVIIGAVVLMGISMIAYRLVSFPGELVISEMQEFRDKLPAGTGERLAEIARREVWTGLWSFVVIGSTVSLLVGIWLSRGLTAPLGELEAAAQAIEAKDLSYRVPVQGTQELKAVATAFNQMAEQLEAAESLRSNLLADVAHEVRGPLHLLRGNLQAILDGVYPLDQKEIVRLFDQTNHLTRMVNDLHELAQAEADQVRLHKEKTVMSRLVKETAEVFRPPADARDVSIRVELLGPIPPAEVDAARMRQVIYNLLSNALRHSPAGGCILVQLQQVETELVISVQDQGSGILPEHLGHVFDRFYRTDSGRSRDHGGVGLGLAIVKALVEAHGGQIQVASPGAAGGGTIFTVSLPV